MSKYFCFVLFLVLSYGANSEGWKVADNLVVTPPENLDVTFQVIEEISSGEELIYGWKGENLSYFINVDVQSAEYSIFQHWALIMAALKTDDEFSRFSSTAANDFKTLNNQQASCRSLSYMSDAEMIYQSVCIISGESVVYYLLGSSFDDDAEYLASGLKTLTENSIITRPSIDFETQQ